MNSNRHLDITRPIYALADLRQAIKAEYAVGTPSLPAKPPFYRHTRTGLMLSAGERELQAKLTWDQRKNTRSLLFSTRPLMKISDHCKRIRQWYGKG